MDFKYEIPVKLFIHGKWEPSAGSERLILKSAIDDRIVVDDLHAANVEDVEKAVDSAEAALPIWQAMTIESRKNALIKYGDLIIANKYRLGSLDTLVSGKEISVSAGLEAVRAGDLLKYYANYINNIHGAVIPADGSTLQLVHHEPYGITAGIAAFNGPLWTFAMKVAPALAAGNVMILKASELNPLSVLAAAELAIEAGIPPGTLNVFTGGVQAGEAVASHMKIRKLSFTGSVAVGKQIQIAAAKSNLKHLTLELGGKTPVIIFQDADIQKAAMGATGFTFFNGQGCVLGTRIYVQKSVLEQFLQHFLPLLEARRENLGTDSFDPSSKSSPMYNHRQFQRVLEYIERGKSEGTLIAGGHRVGTKGCYIAPTVFLRPEEDASVLKEEIFGPVAILDTFETEEEVLLKANKTELGLAAAIYTNNLARALRLAPKLEAGTVTVNSSTFLNASRPFGGWKQSGIGREMGLEGILDFTQSKTIVFSE